MQLVDLHPNLLLAYSEVSDGNMDVRFSPPATVKKNRQAFLKALKLNSSQVIEGEQIHFTRLLVLTEDNSKMWKGQSVTGVDGFLTQENSIAILLRLADCVPVVFFDPSTKALAVVHAGWRGTAKGIHTLAFERLQTVYHIDPSQTLVWLGPAAGPCHYRFDKLPQALTQPVWKPFVKKVAASYAVDLSGYIMATLKTAGLFKKNMTQAKRCTIEDEALFSHARSRDTQTVEGRFAFVAKLK